VSGSVRAERNYAFETIMNHVAASTSFQTLSYWNGNLRVGYFGEALDDRLTRGGPSSRRPPQVQVNGHFNSDSRRTVTGGGGFGFARNTAGGWGVGGGVGVTVRPAPNWTFSISPNFDRSHTVAQYLGARGDPTAGETFGSRYLFAALDQTTLAMETRLDVTFTPALSLQVYAQPFISSAAFGAPAQLSMPGVYEFQVYGRDIGDAEPVAGGTLVYPQGRDGAAASFVVPDADFTVRSLRGNAVLRWEYRPGSTIFVAWQQNRSSSGPSGDFDFGRNRAALFDEPSDDVFVIKMSYWINP
jgi:hypothetical protein